MGLFFWPFRIWLKPLLSPSPRSIPSVVETIISFMSNLGRLSTVPAGYLSFFYIIIIIGGVLDTNHPKSFTLVNPLKRWRRKENEWCTAISQETSDISNIRREEACCILIFKIKDVRNVSLTTEQKSCDPALSAVWCCIGITILYLNGSYLTSD